MPRISTPFAEAELLDHAAGHEGVGQLADVVGGRIAEEAVAVGVHFQHAAALLERPFFAGIDRLGLAAVVVARLKRRIVAIGPARDCDASMAP